MKVGDILPVAIQGIHVANATIEAYENNEVTLVFPGTRVVMAASVQLTNDSKAPEREVIYLDAEGNQITPPSEKPADKPVEPTSDKPVEPVAETVTEPPVTVETIEPVVESEPTA